MKVIFFDIQLIKDDNMMIYCTKRAFATNKRLMHCEHKLPPNGRSGRFFVFGNVRIWYGNPRGTAFNTALHSEQEAALGFRLP